MKERLKFAKDLAREVGDLARELQQGTKNVELKGHQDYVSEVDKNLETIIRNRIRVAFPEDECLGEEHGGSRSDSYWIVDPIDGTSNYVRGQDFWCVSIAHMTGDKPDVGVIYAPAPKQLFSAGAGLGAMCNEESITVSDTNDPNTAVVEMDWSPSLPRQDFLNLIENLLEAGFEFHRSGSCALSLANVAKGSFDAYVELFTKPWDAMAGYLLVREAGGATNDFLKMLFENDGNPIVASGPNLICDLQAAVGIE